MFKIVKLSHLTIFNFNFYKSSIYLLFESSHAAFNDSKFVGFVKRGKFVFIFKVLLI
jgi:hypothetical protein